MYEHAISCSVEFNLNVLRRQGQVLLPHLDKRHKELNHKIKTKHKLPTRNKVTSSQTEKVPK